MTRTLQRTSAVGAVALGVLAILPASAFAGVRYAAPTAHPMADPALCAESMPCDIETAAEHASVANGDEVVLLPGTYTLLGGDDVNTDDDIFIHGQPGQPRPVIDTAAFNGFMIDDSPGTPARPVISDVVVTHSGGNGGILVFGAIAERVDVTSSSGVAACAPLPGIGGPGLIRDSVCRHTDFGAAVGMFAGSLSPETISGAIRNVTAIATGVGSAAIFVNSTGEATVQLDGRNVIAQGASSDVSAADDAGGGTSIVTLASSNYDVELELGDATVTDPGSGTNQLTPPLFVNAAAGDFHQAAGSVTIDAGAVDGMLGSTDIDGQPRVSGSLPDIGADESPAVAQPTGLPKKPCKKKRKKKRKPKAAASAKKKKKKKKRCKKRRKKPGA